MNWTECLLTDADHSRLSWAWPMVPWPGGVENDFLEVPSMLAEQWVYDRDIMRQVSRHYKASEEGAVGDTADGANGVAAAGAVVV